MATTRRAGRRTAECNKGKTSHGSSGQIGKKEERTRG
jgi:hypothetical protein